MAHRAERTWEAEEVLTALVRRSSTTVRAGLARFGIPDDTALGVTVAGVKALAREIGRDHALAARLWDTNVYEARLLVAYVADPQRLSVREMDRWCRGFDNWAVCDTLCFALFDRTPHAWGRVHAWAARRPEFERRAAFALLWALALHDKTSPDARFAEGLRLIEAAAADDRHFVKKAVSMALRAIGKRRPALRPAAAATAERLAAADAPAARWVGKDALRELRAGVVRRVPRPRSLTPRPARAARTRATRG